MKILVINGPNMNMLGIREPEIYGKMTLENLENSIRIYAEKIGISVSFMQSNHEGTIIDAIQKAYFNGTDGIVINPAAYTHTSIAIADAVRAVNLPTVEVHISDTDSREDFRKISFIRPYCIATVKGKGFDGYYEALDIIKNHLEKSE